MTESVLGEIAARKKVDLAARYGGVTLDRLREQATPTDRSLVKAIARPGARFILEIKKASPSEGAIRATADPAGLAAAYSGIADALSVLCDEPYFGGSLDDLTAARGSFDGPILAKDFFLDVRQVVEARIAGADAVLVMLSLLDDQAAREIIGEANRFGMDALVEVHDEAEMHRALALGAPLIGINNRDLRDLSIDLSATERLAQLAPDRLLISESGIRSRADVERLSGQVDGFLVGTSLMRAAEPSQAARELVFGRVKLCGLNREEDIAAASLATFAGLVFVPESPRYLTAEQAAPLAGLARRSGILPVGVFRNEELGVVADVATLLNLHAVQLHGEEDADYISALREHLPPATEIWAVASVGRGGLSPRGAERILFDNADGGSGRAFDWSAIADHPNLAGAIVAGGIGVENARAAQALGAYAIDVGSSVDETPGVKSAQKIAELFNALRPACREAVSTCA
ncbi:indole-3-glycerol phosphate synthase / phosphoribosylanthranilate isomerase [Sphingomonas sp. F9_3S_D5_B_2]